MIATRLCVSCFSTASRTSAFVTFYRCFSHDKPEVASDNTVNIDGVRNKYDVEVPYATMGSPLNKYSIPRDNHEITDCINALSKEEIMHLQNLQERVLELRCMGHKIPEMTDGRWLHIMKNLNYKEFDEVKIYLLRLYLLDKRARAAAKRHRERLGRWMDEDFLNTRLLERWSGLQCPVVPVAHYEKKRVQNVYKNCKLLDAFFDGQRIVWDCAWDHANDGETLKSVSKQMCLSYKKLQNNCDPFHLVLTGYSPDSHLALYLRRTLFSSWLSTTTTESYLDLFPKEKLVYLTPDSPNVLEEFSHNDIYIIGMLVASGIDKPWTMSKAQSDGIRTARFPLDLLNENWSNIPVLTIAGSMQVMLSLHSGMDMKDALSQGVSRQRCDLGMYDSRRYPDSDPPDLPIRGEIRYARRQ